MTPAQVAHIMSLVDEYVDEQIQGHIGSIQRAAVEAALRDAPQAEGWVMVPVDVLKAASESLGSFVSDHGWGDADMQAMDNLDAYLAATPSAPTAVEPTSEEVSVVEPRDERAEFEAWYFDMYMLQPERYPLDPDKYAYPHTRDTWIGWQARASKGTP